MAWDIPYLAPGLQDDGRKMQNVFVGQYLNTQSIGSGEANRHYRSGFILSADDWLTRRRVTVQPVKSLAFGAISGIAPKIVANDVRGIAVKPLLTARQAHPWS